MEDETEQRTIAFVKQIKESDSYREAVVSEVSAAFTAEVRKEFSQAEMVAVDHANSFLYEEGVRGTHDFCDANMLMDEAFSHVVSKHIAGSETVNIIDMTEVGGDVESVGTSLWNSAWAKSSAAGFSDLWRLEIPKEDLRELSIALMERPEGVDHEGAYPFDGDIEDDFTDLADEVAEHADATKRLATDYAKASGDKKLALLEEYRDLVEGNTPSP